MDWQQRLILWWLTGQSTSAYRQILQHFGQADAAIQASVADWQALKVHDSHLKRRQQWQDSPRVGAAFAHIFDAIAQQHYHLIQQDDADYPKQLRQIDDPPPFLFVRGDRSCLIQPQVAVVGSRKPSPSGTQIARQFAAALVEQGLWVTSGLAHGIDTEAHLGALSMVGGRTIAVLGTGIDVCYPSNQRGLYDRIVSEGGLIVSEFLPDTRPQSYYFPRRNRIVSGLSLGTLVVEAALKSGSLITARLAAEQGRLVFAVPGHIQNPQAQGCHQLIRDGAILVDHPDQILEDLQLPRRWHAAEAVQSVDAASVSAERISLPEHLQPLMSYLDWTPQDMDLLVENSGWDIASLSSALMELELLGSVVQVAGRYQRCR
ncbi:MAG: DNA-processing protein DprA [Pseudomonadota bacterium]|nr:DNA-processing protein DprA [Pseudomonadota bacterium]